MAYWGNEPAKVAVKVGSDAITTTQIEDGQVYTADLQDDAVTANKIDDDGTGFRMGSLGLGAATFSGDITGTLATASQGNITSVGTLTSFTSTGIDDNAGQTALSITSEGRVQHTSAIANSCFDIANTHASGYGAHIQAGSGTNYSLVVKDKDNNERFTVLGNGNSTFAGNVSLKGDSGTLNFLNASGNQRAFLQLSSTGLIIDTDSFLEFKPNNTRALYIDSSLNSTFAGTVLIDGLSNYTGLEVKGSGGSRPQVKWTNANNGVIGSIYGTEANALVLTSGTGGATALTLDSSQDATFAGVVNATRDASGFNTYVLNENGAGEGLHIKVKGNDGGQTGRYLIKAEGYGSTGAYSNNFLVDTDGNATFAGSISAGYGKSHRLTGNWKVIDVVSEDSNDVSTMSSNNCFNDQTYSHFKIIIPWMGFESQCDLLCSFLYNSGSGLQESAQQYYGHKQTATHSSSSYGGAAYDNVNRMTIFNNTWTDDSGGVNGEVLVYNVTTADMRNFSGTTYTAHDHTGDGDRGSNFRPFATFNIIGYDTSNGYGAQHGSFRQNDDKHASYWKGIRFTCSTGNFATGSKFIVMGMQL